MTEKVLLVDDEQDFLETLAARMRARDMEVATAAEARTALEQVADGDFDAVILDLQMPEMDGIETLKALKAKNPDLQVILLTGHATAASGVEAMKLGAVDFLEKPADLRLLLEKIRAAKATRMLIAEKKTQEKIRKILEERSW
ncbi:MAG: response regulator [Planctomycetota bacterium]